MTKNMIAALFATVLFGSVSVPVLAADENYAEYHPVTSMEAFLHSSVDTAMSYSMAAELAMKAGNYDQAIKLCQQAMGKDNDDADIHMMYAQCLQAKLKTQVDKDPKLFNKCVKEWLLVFKNEVGEERGISNSRGISLPFLSKLYMDQGRGLPAMQNLITLTGSAPKFNETDSKYLKRVCKEYSTDVSAKLLSNSSGGDD